MLYYFSPTVSDLEAKLNADLQKIGDWLISNQLTLNTTKTKVMLIGSSRKLCKVNSISVHVYNSVVEGVEDFKYLGVTFSSVRTYVYCMYVCMPVCLSVRLFVRLSVRLPVCLSVCLSVCLCS